ncbi:MAG: hypothetical protein E4H14_19890 [Candidatus Thorarchaeota archaeon]|nr:MAG: hypothetical protein E4H14_19890 [Candidatus Thorarchaeota archaeon]
MKYKEWLLKVDNILIQQFGLGTSDLEDYTWCDLFDDDYIPSEAVEDYLESDYAPVIGAHEEESE